MLNCSAVNIPALVGPAQVFASLGHWNTAVMVILALHLGPIWMVSGFCLTRLKEHCPLPLRPTFLWLISLPPALLTLASIGILLPSSGQFVEVLLEIVICLGLVKFCHLCRLLCGGDSSIVSYCQERKILLPIGAPPLVCLLPAPKPQVTRTNFALVAFMPKLLLAFKVLLLTVDLVYLGIGYQPSGNFLAIDNLHNVLSFPVGLIAIYAYTIFNFLMNDCLEGNSKRFLGIILLLEFILFDCLRLFFIFLTGTGMLTCVPPFLSQGLVVHTLKNYIKGFLTMFIGIPYLTMCATRTEMTQMGTLGRMDSEVRQYGSMENLGKHVDAGSAEDTS